MNRIPHTAVAPWSRLFAALVLCMCLAHCSGTKPKVALTSAHTQEPPVIPSERATNSAVVPRQSKAEQDSNTTKMKTMSPATQLMVRACDNYLSLNPGSPKISEVLLIKASVYYNNKLLEECRNVYKMIIDNNAKDPHALEAVRMIAQSYYEEKRFDDAQVWYRKLKDIAGEGGDKQEALVRIAESIFKLGEMYDGQQRFKDAAAQYERVALEFADSKIADVSLFNAGLAYEKLTEWAQAILMFQRLLQKYPSSKLLAKAQFRTAKSYEKLLQWDNAAETYLRVVANYPGSELSPVALYNAGFSFENAEKPAAAAATFEKMSQLYPKSDEIADVLFKAGEIYGKLKDWVGVTRVNQEFARRFGSDANRVIQAQCMVGVALYMQNKQNEALGQLQQALTTYTKLKNPSAVNKYYAAKAEFTIAEISLEMMNKVALSQPKETYKRQLGVKMDALDKAVASYSRVVGYQISEWTTRSVCQIGQAYEDFAVGIFKQERMKNASLEDRLALELGIAKAVEEYFVTKAAHFHEQNIKLGIKEKIEDKYILQSRKKLTLLPLLAGENYLALVDIAQSAVNTQKLDGFALIAKKLELLQKIAPFQERAIGLFLKCLELGSQYQELDESYIKASNLITKNSCTVGETYSDVATIARDAPIPSTFDAYESFVYKTKLLKQIEGYEDKGLENLLRTVKIAEAYKIDDDFVKRAKVKIPELLFVRGRCYDVLCQSVVNDPPYPGSASVAEREEYQGRFEEIGLRFQENAVDIYKEIMNYAKLNYAVGPYVTHAYVRLFQNAPKDFGQKMERIQDTVIASGPEWKCNDDSVAQWNSLEFNDQTWYPVSKGQAPKGIEITGFPTKELPKAMWYGEGDPKSAETYKPAQRLFVRKTIYCYQVPPKAKLYLAAIDQVHVFLNGDLLPADTGAGAGASWTKAQSWDLRGKMRAGKNVVAITVTNTIKMGSGIYAYLVYTSTTNDYVPLVPGSTVALEVKQVAQGAYEFPVVKNFIEKKSTAKKIGEK